MLKSQNKINLLKMLIPTIISAFVSIAVCIVNNMNQTKIFKKTLKDNNRPILQIDSKYNYFFDEDIDFDDDYFDYQININSVEMNNQDVKLPSYNKKFVKLCKFDIKFSNIGKGVAKNISLYDINDKNEEKIFYVYNNNNNQTDTNIIVHQLKEIKLNVNATCYIDKNEINEFYGILFYQDVNDELHSALLSFKICMDNDGKVDTNIFYSDLDTLASQRKIYEYINDSNDKMQIKNKKEASEVILSKMRNTILTKKEEIKEGKKLYNKLKIN